MIKDIENLVNSRHQNELKWDYVIKCWEEPQTIIMPRDISTDMLTMLAGACHKMLNERGFLEEEWRLL